MTIALIVFSAILFMLFLVTRAIVQSLFLALRRFTPTQHAAIHLLTFILLPGTAIHELAHLCSAFLLHVPAGNLTVIPKIEESGEVRAGSVSVAKTDPFRLTLIGLAPIPVGILMLYATITYLTPTLSFQERGYPFLPTAYGQLLTTILGVYLIFVLSCSMFSSKKDLHILLISGPILLVGLLSIYYLGIRISLADTTAQQIVSVVHRLNQVLGLTLVIDATIWGGLFLLRLGGRRLRHHIHHRRHHTS